MSWRLFSVPRFFVTTWFSRQLVFGRSTQNALVFWWFLPPDWQPGKQCGSCPLSSPPLPWPSNVRCFLHFDLEMCFAPQRRALFQQLNFQKCSEPGVFCTFWLRNVLRATMACNFSSLIWPHGSAPAALASLLFDPREPQIIGKTQWVATFLPFRAPESSFFWLFLSSLLFSSLRFASLRFASLRFASLRFASLRFASLTLPTSAFPSGHIVRSLTSKLPSVI